MIDFISGLIVGSIITYYVARLNMSYYFMTIGRTMQASIDCARVTINGKYLIDWIKANKK